jgi:hypothetical protein
MVTPDSNTTLLNTKTFTTLPLFDVSYSMNAKIFNQKGDIVFEYNPFHNLRDANTGELKDFTTNQLAFNLNNPVDIEVQPSYDGTVNLIINDDLNPPLIINSRFTPLENMTYEIVDRSGNTDTNIYEEGVLTEVTRLYKTTQNIPYITFQGLVEGGALQAGNYVFYFKYADADGNESDIIAESGIVSCYVGKLNDPFSTRGGMANELTNKIAKFTLNNLDTAYDYINIYFTRATSDFDEQVAVQAYKIQTRKTVNGPSLVVTITGLEDTIPISVDDLNIQYNVVDAVHTQTQVQNLLFFGNVAKPTIPYQDLQDLALRIYPSVANDNNIGYLDPNYNPVSLNDQLIGSEYYDAYNVYNYTGYWNKEMYRLGVVFIMKDDTLSPVFNIRGKNNLDIFSRVGTFEEDISNEYTFVPLYDEENNRQYIGYDDDGWIKGSQQQLENARGVVRVTYGTDLVNKDDNPGIYPLSIALNVATETLVEMQKFVKGFFLTRQKRIPTILCQGLSIGTDNISFVPTIKAQTFKNTNTGTIGYIAESFIDKSNQLVHDFNSRLLIGTPGSTSVGGLLCPEAVLRSEFFNEIFTGALFNVSRAPFTPTDRYFKQDPLTNRHFYIDTYTNNGASQFLFKDVKLTLIEDGQPLRYSGTKQFSTKAGIAEDAWKFTWFGNQDTGQYASNLIRGEYGGFVGCENFGNETTLIDIHVPGYDPSNMQDYFLLRANSFHPFYAISDRYDLNILTSAGNPYANIIVEEDNMQLQEYRGDCFVGTVTTRMTRNFQDPDTPINDIIIDPLTWKTNYTGYTASGGLDTKKIANINRGDVNAIKMGHWATFKLCSNINLAYRAVDDTFSSEFALTGKARSFFPYAAMASTGESKIPESTVVNVGYNTTTSDKVYILQPNVPFIKNFFDNRIMFSEPSITDSFRNGYRVFKLDAYRDVTRQYGAISAMTEWQNNLMVVFEQGVALIPINEKMVAGSANGGKAYFTSLGVLPDIVNPLSTNYGSAWKDSVLKTPDWVYGVDATAKKIWRTNGQTFEILSDFKVEKFLNDNLTLGQKDKYPVVALRNIKTHYNAFKKDVMFTFVDITNGTKEVKWSLCYNEVMQTWITRFSWMPLASADIENVYFTFNREDARILALVGMTIAGNPASVGIVLDNAVIADPNTPLIGRFSLKGHDYYKQYVQDFTLESVADSQYFAITVDEGGYKLEYAGEDPFPKFYYLLKVRVGLSSDLGEGLIEVQHFFDYIAVIVDRSNLSDDDQVAYDTAVSSWFWKHGQAGIFDTETVILPTLWYNKQEVFEFEFIVADNPSIHKIFDNLTIISNDAEPDSFEFEVIGDSYTFDKPQSYASGDTNYTTDIGTNLVHTYQKGLRLKDVGRRLGNMEYKEDFWDVQVAPVRYLKGDTFKETRIRDKYCRIRVRYSGEQLALITAIVTTFTQSYA